MDNASKMQCFDNGNELREDKNKAKLDAKLNDPEIQDVRKELLGTLSEFFHRKDISHVSEEFMRNPFKKLDSLASIKARNKHNKFCEENGYPKMSPCGD